MVLRAVDLCCGSGGWAVAGRGLPIRWVAVADWARDCLETWRQNHARAQPQTHLVLADLSTAEGAESVLAACRSHAVDLVVGGIPCEQLSVARGANKVGAAELALLHTLIDRMFGVVRSLRPRWFCFEDIIQVEKHLPAPIELGLPYEWQRIEASDYGPQARLRTFVGSFPAPGPAEPGPRTLRDCLRPGPHMAEGSPEAYELVPQAAGRNAARVGNDKMRVLDPESPSPTIMGALSRGSRKRRAFTILSDDRPRTLSWQEAALLQGFPDDYLFAASYMRTEKMVGQAIPIPVGRAILKAIVARAQASEGGAP